MNKANLKNFSLATLSGLMLTLSFPPIDLHWLAWISLVPLLISTTGKSLFAALKLGLITGLTHYLTLIYWIALVLSNYGNINIFISIAIMLFLALYISLYIAFFPIILNFFKNENDILPIFWGASAWIALEYLRAHLLTGLPWCLLGYSQYSIISLIQISDCTGVYGVSFIIVIVNLLMYNLFFNLNIKNAKKLVIKTVFTSILIGSVILYGYYALHKKTGFETAKEKIRAALIQANIDQTLKWCPEFQEKTIDIYRKLSKKSACFNPDIIVWPETAVPFFFQDMSKFSEEIFKISKVIGTNILFGSPAYSREMDKIRYYNRAYVINKDKILGYYDKVHLVPFGEYVPLKKFLPFIHRLVVASGDFLPGKSINPIIMGDIKIGPLICFESIFPNISRIHSHHGSDLLVNITNDAWFGRTSAPYQHLSMAVFRCVENGLPMLRAANTGISAFILQNGKIVKKGRLFTEEVLMEEIKCGSNKTFYSKYGDIFAIMIALAFFTKLFWLILMKKRG
jgi:apolipoprotein N-acyltransferase